MMTLCTKYSSACSWLLLSLMGCQAAGPKPCRAHKWRRNQLRQSPPPPHLEDALDRRRVAHQHAGAVQDAQAQDALRLLVQPAVHLLPRALGRRHRHNMAQQPAALGRGRHVAAAVGHPRPLGRPPEHPQQPPAEQGHHGRQARHLERLLVLPKQRQVLLHLLQHCASTDQRSGEGSAVGMRVPAAAALRVISPQKMASVDGEGRAANAQMCNAATRLLQTGAGRVTAHAAQSETPLPPLLWNCSFSTSPLVHNRRDL